MSPSVTTLCEPETEAIVLGSLICYSNALAQIADDLNPDWFVDPGARVVLDALLKLHRGGHRVSVPTVIATIPLEDKIGGTPKSVFVAGLAFKALPLTHLSGPLSILKDRWARRHMLAEAAILRDDAQDMDRDPFETAGASVASLDVIVGSNGEHMAADLALGTKELIASLDAPERRRFVTTGIAVLDEQLNGYAPGKLYVVAGRPGMGKSAFACSSLRQTAVAGHGVALFSLEMGIEEISARCLADAIDDLNGPFFGSLLKGNARVGDRPLIEDARGHLAKLPFHIDATPGLNFSQIAARARRAKARFNARGTSLDVVAIDHIGLVAPSDRYKGNKVAEAGEISRAGKFLAKELDCCVVLLSQLNRGVEGRDDKRPSLADLRWSGDIEQDADVVAFLYREAYYLRQKAGCDPDDLFRARHNLDFLIRKNRNGEARDVSLWCSMPHSSVRGAK